MNDYINKAQAVAQTIAEIESLGLEVGRELEQRIKNDYISQPSADVVEVVRCKDCEHHEELLYNNDGKVLCWVHGLDVVVDRNGYCNYGKEYDFCSYGERKEK